MALGGGRAEGFDMGFYIAPAVFADVDTTMRIAREEIFGLVVMGSPTTPRTMPRRSRATRTTGSAARSSPPTSSTDSISPAA